MQFLQQQYISIDVTLPFSCIEGGPDTQSMETTNNHEVKAKKVRNSRSNIIEPLNQHLFKDFSLYKKYKLLFFKSL